MSLKKKDQSAPGGLRVAANDPHLVSLGGGRLSTAVTIHYLPVGDMTIGSSPTCDISLNGSGVRPLHCTVFRSESGEVTIVPENDARVLIDGDKITSEANLTQGAMLTIGNSNYLRFNNPAEAQLIKSTMGSNERISMPQIDFTQENTNGSNGGFLGSPDDVLKSLNEAMESQNNQKFNNGSVLEKITKIEYININNFHSPKVFAADSVTVNAPAKDVLGPKYASFAKNLAENHRNDKNFRTKNNEIALKTNNYVNIPSTFIQNSPNSSSSEVLTKVHNNSMSGRSHYQMAAASTYDRYPKPGFGGLQLFPMNCINSEINTISTENHYQNQQQSSSYSADGQNSHQENAGESKMTAQEHERLEEILKICTEYDRQNQNVQSSPIVQNRIKTNGSLPREKKSPFHEINPQHSKTFFPDKTKTNSGYENVKILGDRRIEIGGVSSNGQKSSSGYENVIVGKYIPQSPRTKIRTTCVSPKKEVAITGIVPAPLPLPLPPSSAQSSHASQATEYAHLIQSFEDKLRMEMEAIKECQNNCQSPYDSPKKRPNLNINNLTLNLEQATSQNTSISQSSEVSQNGESHEDLEKVKKDRELVLAKIRKVKTQIADLQREQDEVVREMDMEKALVFAELTTVNADLRDMERNLSTLQGKIHRLEAQRNANRVMQETQQSKLKQSIEMKQDQVSRLENLVNRNSIDEPLKEELTKMTECLENDRKTFEDLEFQYLEEETDWLAYREELHTDLKLLTKSIDEKRMQVLRLESQTVDNQHAASSDSKTLESNLLSLLTALERYRSELQRHNRILRETSDCHINLSESEDDDGEENHRNRGNLMMSQSLFGSAELLSAKPREIDLMSRSVNENLFFNNNIEMPSQSIDRLATSTPKKSLKIFDISDDVTKIAQNGHSQLKKAEDLDITPEIVRRENNDEKDPILRLKYNVDVPLEEQQKRVNLNLSLGSDDFEVNPLERRVPSQDDIDRICKVTLDAPISTKGASSKIIESIKEIERNRQLLLAQQGSHVIEHERQKMAELKKKSHDEARAQYLSLQGGQMSPSHHNASLEQRDYESDEKERSLSPQKDSPESLVNDCATENSYSQPQINGVVAESSQHRHSHPEFEPPRERPLSEVNSELSYDNLSDKQSRSNNDLISHRLSETSEDAKRSSLVSNGTSEGDRLVSGNKRSLPKHQRPLTRYLPIFSPDLDLRQHIESAGHQVGLCPHVFVNSYSCRGYLHKLGATFHGWSRRWFVLDRQKKALIYYSDKSERKVRGGAYFSTIDEVYLDHLNTSKSGHPHCTFIVKTKKRSYHLQAASDAAARIWIDAIITGAQGNFDY